MATHQELYLPHVGWVRHAPGDEVAAYLNQGWYEYREQAFTWLSLRPGDVVVDCGAHFGLYSLIAARAMEDRGTVLAVEPNPESAAVLAGNLERSGATCARVVEGAIAAQAGRAVLYVGGPDKAAFAGLSAPSEDARQVEVRTTTLDALLDEGGIRRVDFVKIDVEGAELDVLEGAKRAIRLGALPLLMVEFNENNLRRTGRTTKELADALTAAKYTLCRFDDERCELVPCTISEPVWYDNVFAAREPETVNARLRAVERARRRVVDEIIQRGRDASRVYARQTAAEERERQTQRSLDAAAERVHMLEQHLKSLLTSKYLRAGWSTRIVRRPEWVDDFLREVEDHERRRTDSAP
ncbi:MAG: FkbM family methyltransferase [Verrucomicrobia bacterium]|nr:FkbM family methyltransferase [Verrucomicrobiota bacterium]